MPFILEPGVVDTYTTEPLTDTEISVVLAELTDALPTTLKPPPEPGVVPRLLYCADKLTVTGTGLHCSLLPSQEVEIFTKYFALL